MAVTRIKNNQISNATPGNSQVGIDAGSKVQLYTIAGNLLANNLSYQSSLNVTGNVSVTGNIQAGNVLTDGFFYSNGAPFVSGTQGVQGIQGI